MSSIEVPTYGETDEVLVGQYKALLEAGRCLGEDSLHGVVLETTEHVEFRANGAFWRLTFDRIGLHEEPPTSDDLWNAHLFMRTTNKSRGRLAGNYYISDPDDVFQLGLTPMAATAAPPAEVLQCSGAETFAGIAGFMCDKIASGGVEKLRRTQRLTILREGHNRIDAVRTSHIQGGERWVEGGLKASRPQEAPYELSARCDYEPQLLAHGAVIDNYRDLTPGANDPTKLTTARLEVIQAHLAGGVSYLVR